MARLNDETLEQWFTKRVETAKHTVEYWQEMATIEHGELVALQESLTDNGCEITDATDGTKNWVRNVRAEKAEAEREALRDRVKELKKQLWDLADKYEKAEIKCCLRQCSFLIAAEARVKELEARVGLLK